MQSAEPWYVYLLRCRDGSLYCGVTNDVDRRLAAHNAGRGARYTRARRPVVLAAVSGALPKSDAFRMEYRIKRLPAGRKIAAIEKGMACSSMTALKGELVRLHSRLAALCRKMDRIIDHC